MEDGTGIFERDYQSQFNELNRIAVTRGKFLQVDGTLQNQDGVINVLASAVRVLDVTDVDVRSRDCH
jgi:error-prone DNA polymerase